MARERIELLLDRDSPFLELSRRSRPGAPSSGSAAASSPASAWSPGVECVITANEPTMKGGTLNPYSVLKSGRTMEMCAQNRLPIINLTESGGADLPYPVADLRSRRQGLPRDHPALRRAHPDALPGVRLVDRRRRLRARHVGLRGDGEGRRQGVPRRAAAGEDGDPRGQHRGGARRRRDAQPRLRRVGLPRGRRARRDPHRARDRRAAQLAQARLVEARARWKRPRHDSGRAARHRLDRRAQAVRRQGGHRPHRRRLALPRVQADLRHDAGHRLRARARLSGRHPRQQRHPVLRVVARRARSSSSSATRPTRRSSSCRTSPASWSAAATRKAASSRTAPS